MMSSFSAFFASECSIAERISSVFVLVRHDNRTDGKISTPIKADEMKTEPGVEQYAATCSHIHIHTNAHTVIPVGSEPAQTTAEYGKKGRSRTSKPKTQTHKQCIPILQQKRLALEFYHVIQISRVETTPRKLVFTLTHTVFGRIRVACSSFTATNAIRLSP